MRRRPELVTLIAIYELVMAAMLLITSCVILPFALVVTPFASDSFAAFLLRFLLLGMSLVLFLGLGVGSLVVGIGLLRLREWARIGAIALAVPMLLGFPLWTVLGILIIYYLGFGDGRDAFLGRARPSETISMMIPPLIDDPVVVEPVPEPATADPAPATAETLDPRPPDDSEPPGQPRLRPIDEPVVPADEAEPEDPRDVEPNGRDRVS